MVKSRGKGSAICLVHPNGRRKHHLSTLDRLVLWRVSCCKSIRSTFFFFFIEESHTEDNVWPTKNEERLPSSEV